MTKWGVSLVDLFTNFLKSGPQTAQCSFTIYSLWKVKCTALVVILKHAEEKAIFSTFFFKSKRSRTCKKSRKLEAANSASKVEEVCAQPAADQGPITASVDVWLVRSKTTTCHWLDRGRQMKAALMCCFSALLVSPRLCKQLPRNRIDFWTKNEK